MFPRNVQNTKILALNIEIYSNFLMKYDTYHSYCKYVILVSTAPVRYSCCLRLCQSYLRTSRVLDMVRVAS
jgi:hypothetical protein